MKSLHFMKGTPIMLTKLIGFVTIILCLISLTASGIGVGDLITKDTQEKMGVNFTLTAVRESAGSVLVKLVAPKEAKLANLSKVRLTIQKEGDKHFLLWANLETTTDESGKIVSGFQISPELAEQSFIELVVETSKPGKPAFERFYHVRVKDYIVDKKK